MKLSNIISTGYLSMPITTILLTGLALLTLVLAAVFLISLYAALRLIHPKRVLPDIDKINIPRYEEVNFKDKNGELNLKGWYFKAGHSENSAIADASKNTVILSHGYLQNRMQFGAQTLDFIKSFLKTGYNVFTFDFRNSGYSEGTLTSVGYYERYDLAGAISWVKRKGAEKVFLWGVSMGAATSIITAAECSSADAVIADCPFSDLEAYLKKNLPVWSGLPSIPFTGIIIFFMKLLTGIETNRVCPIFALDTLAPRPVLFIHSSDDKAIPVSNSRSMFEKYSQLAPGKAFIWDTHSGGHAQSYGLYPEEYMKRVTSFLMYAEKQDK